MVQITPTHVPKSFADLLENLDVVREFAQHVHVDIDDGIFTKTLSWPYERVGVLGPVSFGPNENLEIGVHLMVHDVADAGVQFAKAGARSIIGHIEAFADVKTVPDTLQSWRDAGATEVGLAILIETDVAQLETVVSDCDFVHVLSVATIGEQGAAFDERAIKHVEMLHGLYPQLTISVDGGVNEKNILSLAQAGASRFAIGSAIMHTSNPTLAYRHLKAVAESALQ